jgi:hypothetical protein
MQHDKRNITTREMTRQMTRADTSFLYMGLISKDSLALNWQEYFDTIPVWGYII